MGIINVTPDSFYDGGQTVTESDILKQAETMLEEGATFLDIGGYSSRPGADDVPLAEEMKRVLVAIESILKRFPKALLSIDTFRSEVANSAVKAGAALVNDISAGMLDEAMVSTVANLQVPYIAMHMRGTPQTMQANSTYENPIREILHYFSERISKARAAGINDIIADVGFGFAKDMDVNFSVLNQLEYFQSLKVPLLVGVSRKSMLYKTLNTTPQGALNGTTALHAIALYKGASILRTHDVKEAVECVKLVDRLKTAAVSY